MPVLTPQPARGAYILIALVLILIASTLAGFDFGANVLFAQSSAPGGFLQTGPTLSAAPLFSAAQIQAFLPSRGRFTFPAPYSTEGIRLTNASDCAGGGDCVESVGYSYWRNINNHAGSDTMLIALGLDRKQGGAGPSLFSYNKVTGVTRNLGPMFDPDTVFGWATGEGWYFSATQPTMLYVNDGPRVFRYDVLSRQFSLVFDISSQFGGNRWVWQMHTSSDDMVHSFSVKDASSYNLLGCGVYLERTREYRYFPATAGFDECQVDKS